MPRSLGSCLLTTCRGKGGVYRCTRFHLCRRLGLLYLDRFCGRGDFESFQALMCMRLPSKAYEVKSLVPSRILGAPL